MTTHKWLAPTESLTTALTTELNSLADGSYSAASAAIDNATDIYQWMVLELVLASLTPATSPYVAVYLIPSADGTNYADGGGATAPPAENLICVFSLSTSTGAKRRVSAPMMIPPLKFKLVLLNEANVALASSGNTLSYRRWNEQDV